MQLVLPHSLFPMDQCLIETIDCPKTSLNSAGEESWHGAGHCSKGGWVGRGSQLVFLIHMPNQAMVLFFLPYCPTAQTTFNQLGLYQYTKASWRITSHSQVGYQILIYTEHLFLFPLKILLCYYVYVCQIDFLTEQI